MTYDHEREKNRLLRELHRVKTRGMPICKECGKLAPSPHVVAGYFFCGYCGPIIRLLDEVEPRE